MTNCRDCKWWDKEEIWNYPGWRECTCPGMYPGCGDDSENIIASAGGSEGYGDSFRTKGEFGCILGETKQ